MGREREVLAEGPSRAANGQMAGRTIQNRTVNFEAPAETAGRLVLVKIEDAYSHSLKGKIILG